MSNSLIIISQDYPGTPTTSSFYQNGIKGTVTGSFAIITALADSNITVSGSELGEFDLILMRDYGYTAERDGIPANIIEAITVNTDMGAVSAQTFE